MNILRRNRIVGRVVLLSALLLICVGVLIRARAQATKSPVDPAAYKLADGPYAVETIDQTIHDAKRSKDLRVRFLIPKSGGPFPVIVFSHGAGGSGQNYFPLTRFWDTPGSVVIQPTHNNSITLRKEKGET